VAVYGRAHKAGCSSACPPGETELIVQAIPGGKQTILFIRKWKDATAESACSPHARRFRHPEYAGGLWTEPPNADGALRAGTADCMREHCEPAAGARDGAEIRDVHTHSFGSGAVEDHSAIADGKRDPVHVGRHCGAGDGLCRYANTAGAGVSGRAERSHSGEPAPARADVWMRTISVDRYPIR